MPPPAVKGPQPGHTISPDAPVPGTKGNDPKTDVIQRFLNHLFPSSSKSETLRPPAKKVGEVAAEQAGLGKHGPVALSTITIGAGITGTRPRPIDPETGELLHGVNMLPVWNADP